MASHLAARAARRIPACGRSAVTMRVSHATPALPASISTAASAFFASPTPVFPHPYFGGLSAAQGVRFLGMHNHHHWKIVRDIRRRAERVQPAAGRNR